MSGLHKLSPQSPINRYSHLINHQKLPGRDAVVKKRALQQMHRQQERHSVKQSHQNV